jgi:hypothetical protein
MSHALELSDEQYALMKKIGDETGRTPEEMLLAWTMEEEGRYRRAHPTYYTTHDWMRHLGVSEEEIAEIEAEASAEDASGSAPDADA